MGRRAPVRSAAVSVAIAELETGEVVYARNPDQAETIASVTKMLSSAAALHYLGPTYKFHTTFWRRGEVHDGNLVGSLLVVGGGDPNISGRFYENDSFAVFDRWAEGLKQAGIVRVSGDLILNASAFDGIYRHPDWPPDRDTRWYQAPISALSYNDNVVIVSVGRGALPGAPAIVSIDPDTDIVQSARARENGRQDRQGARRRGAARRVGPGVRGRNRPGAILPLLGAARDRRPAEVLRRRAEEPAAGRAASSSRAPSSRRRSSRTTRGRSSRRPSRT